MPGLPLMTRPVLALDLGGTQVRAATILADGSRIARQSTSTPLELGPAAVVRACIEILSAALADTPADLQPSIAGIGVSSPGRSIRGPARSSARPTSARHFHDIPIAAAIGGRPRPAGLPGPGHERRGTRRAGIRGRPRNRRLPVRDGLDRRRRCDRHGRPPDPRARRHGRRARPRVDRARRPAVRLRRAAATSRRSRAAWPWPGTPAQPSPGHVAVPGCARRAEVPARGRRQGRRRG